MINAVKVIIEEIEEQSTSTRLQIEIEYRDNYSIKIHYIVIILQKL